VIEVLLIGDFPLHLEGLAVLLSRDPSLHVTTTTEVDKDLGRHAAAADVVIVDIPGPDALQAIRLAADAGAPTVALGLPDAEHDAIAFAECGVLGFVEREASLDDLVATILSAARGEASFPPRIATALLRRVTSLGGRRAPADGKGLTHRERQIVQLIEEGLSNKEIGARLSIEVATVKNHVHNILEKLEVSRRSDAAARLRVVERSDPSPAVALRSTRSKAG
jgi:two-component system nitrate/nitrite response regulator NarL